MKKLPVYGELEALVDNEDFNTAKNFKWYINKGGYVVANISHRSRPYGGTIYLHRLILKINDSRIFTDHINHNKLDNRKSNLRTCSPAENCRNRTPSKYTVSGIGRYKKTKYRARIMINKKDVHIGIYKSLDMAIDARKKAERKYFQDYRYRGGLHVCN